MDIGLHLPSAQAGADARGILDVARGAERLGFDTVWMFDHLFTPSRLDSKYPYSRDGAYPLTDADPFFDPLALLGVLAGATETIEMGTGVLIAAYRHPIVLAKVVASVERFAPGRIVLGLGAGWMREEFDALGIGYERRGARLAEYVSALRSLWNGEPTAFEGEFYAWPRGGFAPAPSAPVPIVLGGHSDAALRRAARLGDGWAAATGRGQGSGIAAVAARIERLRAFLEREGRDPAGYRVVYQNPLWFSDEPNERLPLTGPPEAVAESLARLGDAGVTAVDLLVFGPAALIVEVAERFSEEVRPLLAAPL